MIYHQLFDECWTANRSSHLLVSFQTPFKSTYLLQSYIYVHVFLLQTPENRVASWCANNSYSYDTFRNFSLIYLKLCLLQTTVIHGVIDILNSSLQRDTVTACNTVMPCELLFFIIIFCVLYRSYRTKPRNMCLNQHRYKSELSCLIFIKMS